MTLMGDQTHRLSMRLGEGSNATFFVVLHWVYSTEAREAHFVDAIRLGSRLRPY